MAKSRNYLVILLRYDIEKMIGRVIPYSFLDPAFNGKVARGPTN